MERLKEGGGEEGKERGKGRKRGEKKRKGWGIRRNSQERIQKFV